MTMDAHRNLGEGVMGDELADGPELCALLGVTSRQLSAWYARRERNGFPEPKEIRPHGGTMKRTARSAKLWDRAQVMEWHRLYVPSKGGAQHHRRNRPSG